MASERRTRRELFGRARVWGGLATSNAPAHFWIFAGGQFCAHSSPLLLGKADLQREVKLQRGAAWDRRIERGIWPYTAGDSFACSS